MTPSQIEYQSNIELPQEALDECAKEPIHLAGSIQPYGYLIVFDPNTLEILQVSQNLLDNFFEGQPAALQGVILTDILPPDSDWRERFRNAAEGEMIGVEQVALNVRGAPRQSVFIHKSKSLGVAEFIADAPEENNAFGQSQQTLKQEVNLLMASNSRSLTDFCQNLAIYFRQLSGYDRVMIYQFDAENNGTVIGEAKRAELPAYLNLHYPASDIPEQARRLYLLNRTRVLSDIEAVQIPLVPPFNPLTGNPLDMSYSLLRSFSPVHHEYLRNMGVRATLTVSIIVNGRLWGLIACHHYAPKTISTFMRLAADGLAELISVQIAARENLDRAIAENQAEKISYQLTSQMLRGEDWVTPLLDAGDQLLQITDSSGVAVVRGEKITTFGVVPNNSEIKQILEWTKSWSREKVLALHSLSRMNARFEDFQAVASGVLIAEINRRQNEFVIWFRPEQPQEVTWGGDPRKGVVEENGHKRLTPRKSFELWVTNLTGTARSWERKDIFLAEALRTLIIDVVFEFMFIKEQLTNNELYKVHQAIESLQRPLLVTDAEGNQTFCNQTFLELFSSVHSTNGTENSGSGFDCSQAKKVLQKAISGAGGLQTEVVEQTAEGEEIPMLVTVDVIARDRRIVGYVMVCTDLRERVKAENERLEFERQLLQTQRLESLGILTGGIAHDFNNLLTAIISSAELALSKTSPHDKMAKWLGNIERSAHRAADLCRQLLAYSGRGDTHNTTFDLNEIIVDMTELLKVALPQSVEIEFQLTPEEALISGDIVQIRQVFMNLITNAAEAIGDKSGTISVLTASVKADTCFVENFESFWNLQTGDYILLRVTDTGCGMTQETLAKIFEPFFTTKFTGRGLGLSAVMGIVKKHKGAMKVESAPGSGTNFEIVIPTTLAA
jgi:two-component system, chemotaxis family, sensor kinase Cph1